jgi:glucan phosphoethanolaminetransferase (alkaline phosphatase superfamily)
MVRRILMIGFLTTTLQIIIFILIIFLGWSVVRSIHDVHEEEINRLNFGAQIYIIGLGFILFVTNLLIAIINRPFWTRVVMAILISIFVIGLITSFQYGSWDTTLLSFGCTLTVILKFAIEKLILLTFKKINSGFAPNQP